MSAADGTTFPDMYVDRRDPDVPIRSAKAGHGQPPLQELSSAVRMGEADRLKDLLGYLAPWIGPDSLRQPTPVGKGAALDSSEDSLKRPGLHRIRTGLG
jgi:hypothetical protein